MFTFHKSLDPCLSDPCEGQNSYCQTISAIQYNCNCQNGHLAISGNSAKFGCKPIPSCGPNSDLHMNGSCQCLHNFYEEALGDAESTKGCQSKI